MRSHLQARVDNFMIAAEQGVPESLTVPDEKTRKLRAKLILEEALETIEALGFYCETGEITRANSNYDSEGVVDGCCDLMVVTLGTLSSFGVSDLNHFNEVCDSNDAKFAEGVIKDENGKVQKPKGWSPPDHSKYLPDWFLDHKIEEKYPLFDYSSANCEPTCGSHRETKCANEGGLLCRLKRLFNNCCKGESNASDV